MVLVKPLSFMNDSGRPLGKIARWWKTQPADVLVVVDDLDLPFGRLRMRENGSSGGHNGLKSLIEHFGEEFPRLRVGIGRDGSGEAINRVLGDFSSEEAARLPVILEACVRGISLWLESTSVTAINFINSFKSDI